MRWFVPTLAGCLLMSAMVITLIKDVGPGTTPTPVRLNERPAADMSERAERPRRSQRTNRASQRRRTSQGRGARPAPRRRSAPPSPQRAPRAGVRDKDDGSSEGADDDRAEVEAPPTPGPVGSDDDGAGAGDDDPPEPPAVSPRSVPTPSAPDDDVEELEPVPDVEDD